MNKLIKKIVIVGGGTAGWMSAAFLKKILGPIVDINLVESEDIGTIGVGEATIPPIRDFNAALGINEINFLRETNATIKLAIKFDNWLNPGSEYFHTFGAIGKPIGLCSFHHFWLRANQSGYKTNLWDYDLNYLCATANKYAPIESPHSILEMQYAYHFDASLYAKFLRKYSESRGVKCIEGLIHHVSIHADTGFIEKLHLKNGDELSGDLFIDCSGLRALLMQKLNVGYEDWSHWSPCDRAIAVPSERLIAPVPYTRAIAHGAGWQWRIPLQHRNGNGLVYSSQHYSDDEAAAILLSHLDGKALSEPNFIRFKTGRRVKQWDKNVVSIGLSSGFIEPLESTSIHLIQSAIVRIAKLFPHAGINLAATTEFNKQSKYEFELIRDFIILHYHLNKRDDTTFWKNLRNMDIPEGLSHKIELFRQTGNIFREREDLFLESSWLQVMLGQGIMPGDYHPLADAPSENELKEMLENMRKIKSSPLKQLPSYAEYLNYVRTQ